MAVWRRRCRWIDPADGSNLTRFARSLSSADRRSLVAMGGFIVLLHVVGFGVLLRGS